MERRSWNTNHRRGTTRGRALTYHHCHCIKARSEGTAEPSETPGTTDNHSHLLSVRYIDHDNIIAEHQTLRYAVEYIRSDEIKAVGLYLNLSKCGIWWPHDPTEDIKAPYPAKFSNTTVFQFDAF